MKGMLDGCLLLHVTLGVFVVRETVDCLITRAASLELEVFGWSCYLLSLHYWVLIWYTTYVDNPCILLMHITCPIGIYCHTMHRGSNCAWIVSRIISCSGIYWSCCNNKVVWRLSRVEKQLEALSTKLCTYLCASRHEEVANPLWGWSFHSL